MRALALSLRSVLLAVIAAWANHATAETRILFVSDKAAAGSFDLFSIAADGTDLVQLTATPTVSEWAPALSPDGTRIAFVNRSAGAPFTGTIHLMDIAGGMAAPVPNATSVLCVQWLDDSTIVYLRRTNASGSIAQYQVRRIGVDGLGDALVYSAGFDTFVTGSDSFHLDRSAGRLYISDLTNGGQPAVILSGLVAGTGTDTTFTRCTDVDQGTTQVQLVDHYDPMVSPDGTKLAYCADHGSGRHRLYVRALGNDCATQLRLSNTFCGDPEWSPDSSWIAFTLAATSSFGSSPYLGNIVRVPATGGTPTNLTGTLTAVSGRCAHAMIFLSACAPVEFTSVVRSNNSVTMTWPAVPGGRYQVQYSSELGAWQQDLPGSALIAPAGATEMTFTDSNPSAARRFYRLRGVCP